MARSPTFPARSARTGAWRDSSAHVGQQTRRNGQQTTASHCNLFKSIVTVAGGANPVELVADLRDGFQVMRFRGAVGLVRCVRQVLDVAVPVWITRPLR